MTFSEDEFKEALGCFASGVTVVTMKNDNGIPYGMTVSAFCSVSLKPPLILVCIENETVGCQILNESDVFGVNILAGIQQQISDRFASLIPDRFEGIESICGPNGMPLLKDALVRLECRRKDVYEGGDHSIFVGEVIGLDRSKGDPLIHCRGRYRNLQADLEGKVANR